MRRLSLFAALWLGCSAGSGGSSTLTGPDAFPVAYTALIVTTTDGGFGGFIGGLAETDLSPDFVASAVCSRTNRLTTSVNTRVVSLALSTVGSSPPPLQLGMAYPTSNIYLDELYADGGSEQLAGQGNGSGSITFTALSTSAVSGSFSSSLTEEDGGQVMLGGTFSAAPIVCN